MKAASDISDNTSLNSGFTLMEIMITIVVISIMFSVGVASYISFNNTQLSKSALSNLKNDLRSIESNTNSGVKPIVCGANIFTGYKVVYIDKNSYKSQIICNAPHDDRTFILPTGIEFYDSSFSGFQFLTLSRGVDSQTVITLKNTKNFKCVSLTITISGEFIENSTETPC